jgi:hypothetical protein
LNLKFSDRRHVANYELKDNKSWYILTHDLCPNFTSIFTHLAPKHDSLLLYAFFWVIPRCLNFICRRFGTLCLFHLHRKVGVEFYTYPPVKMEETECSEMSAYKIQTPGNYPEKSIQHSEHGERFKLSIMAYFHRTQSQIKNIRKTAKFMCHIEKKISITKISYFCPKLYYYISFQDPNLTL